LDFAGTLIVQPGQTLTIHDADMANLGRLTELRGQAVIIAGGGLEIGDGERLIGTGQVHASLMVRAGGTLAPGLPVGALRVADLTLAPGATLELDIAGMRPGSYDQLIASGPVIIDLAFLRLHVGQFAAQAGTVFTLIANAGSATIQGLFVDSQGTPLPQGTRLQVGNLTATLSYVGGTQLNILELITAGPQFFIPVRVGGDAYLTLFIPAVTTIQVREEPPLVLVERGATEASSQVAVFDRASKARDIQLTSDVRLFFRIVDDALAIEMDQQFELDPEYLANLPSFFEAYRFPDGHYRIYLQEAGSEQVRLVLDVHVYEGKVVPENYREEERPFAPEPVRRDEQSEQAPESSDAPSQRTSPADDGDVPQSTLSIAHSTSHNDASTKPRHAQPNLGASARLLKKWCS
jgi:hypothetical protein